MKASKIIQPIVSVDCDCDCTSNLIVENNKFYYGTFGHKLNIGDIESKNIIRSRTPEEIESIALYQDYIFAAGDGFIGMFDKIIGTLLCEFPREHEACIHGLIIHQNTLISGCKEIKIWDLESKKCIATLEAEESQELVRSFAIKDNFLIAGYYGGAIIIWDLISKELVQILNDHTSSVTSLIIHENVLISASGDDTIKMWDLESRRCIGTLIGHNAWITSMALHKNYLFSASNASLVIWDLAKEVFLNSLQLDYETFQLFTDKNFLYTISEDDALLHQWSLTDLITDEPLEALISQDYLVKDSRRNKVFFVLDKYK